MNPEVDTSNSGSISDCPVDLTYNATGENRHLAVLRKEMDEMKQELHTLKTEQIIKESQFPTEVLESSGILPIKPRKLKRGRGYRPILRSEIEEAKAHTPFAAAQARYLGIAQCTFRKYAEQYGLYEPRPNAKGKRNLFDPERGKYPISKIITGEFNGNPAISNWMVRDKLIRAKLVPPKCNICGYDKRRITDRKIYILLDHKDGDMNNWKLDNLQLLCGNCTFECGRGYIRRGNHMFAMDPDMMEGARSDDIDDQARW